MARTASWVLLFFLFLTPSAFPGEVYTYLSSAPRPEAESAILRLALDSLKTIVRTGSRPTVPPDLPPVLMKPSGAFVTLTRNGHPRGCMGSLLPTTGSLAEEIIRAVFMASREDGRVRPVSSSELQGLEISVSIPGPLKRIGGTAALSPARLGLMVRCGSRTALLLPGEAGSAEWQLEECRRKAGLPAGSRVEMFVFPAVTLTRSPESGREARR